MNSGGSGIVPSKSLLKFFSLFCLAGLLLVSCEEDPTEIGKELLPGEDFVNIESTDTIKPVSFTMYDESIRTDNPATAYLGQTWDPYFGTTTATFVSQIRLKPEWDGKPFTVDSMKLVLGFTSVKGGSGGTHTLTISEIASDIDINTPYYSNTEVPLAGFTMDIPLPALSEDSVNYVQINLPDLSFANRLLADTSMLFHSNKVPDFRSYFKGLYFKINSTGDPLMTSLTLAYTTNSNDYFIINRYYKNFFVIFYHDDDGNKKEAFFILDAFNTNAAFNQFKHDFSTADPGKRIQHFNDPSYRDTLTYLQSLNGLYTRITLPGLAELKKSGNLRDIAINKARLTVPFYTNNDNFKKSNVPKSLYLRYRTVKGTKPSVPDYYVDQEHLFYDGLADTTNSVYNFNIATFVQKYLEDASGDILPELELVQLTGTKNVILRTNSSEKPVTFNFTYTRF